MLFFFAFPPSYARAHVSTQFNAANNHGMTASAFPLKFITSGASDWSVDSGFDSEYYHDGDAAVSGDPGDSNESCLQAIVDSDSSETLKFWWKVSCDSGTDYLRFYIGDSLQDSITGDQDWAEKSYTVSSGIHTLKWVYEDNGGDDGDNCGWVDFVQWTGASPVPDSDNWQQIDYKYDVYGRRSEKKVDGYGTRYLYDGDHVIAEYDGNNNLLRKYIYGPGIDLPVSMIEVADSNAAYYYHYDSLGSVIALSDSSGDTVQTYEYSVFGEPAVEDANHTNPYMFAGRRYDIEIGLYYNRARYYNPYTGRFLQTDPVGYGDGMNMYAYCSNSPLTRVDPSGLWASYTFVWQENSPQHVLVQCWNDIGQTSLGTDFYFEGWGDLRAYVESGVGDFCDVDVSSNIPIISFSEDVPEYSTMSAIYTAMGLASPSKREYDKIRTDVIMRNAKQSLWRYMNGFNGGEFDFAKTDPGGTFVLEDGTTLNANDFGNYIAGYAGFYHLGPSGVFSALMGGHGYALLNNAFKIILNLTEGQPAFEGVPVDQTWLDSPMDQYWVARGSNDATAAAEHGDYYWDYFIDAQLSYFP